MDIDLLSKMVKELILDNDRVVLPGLGAFVAEIVPSTFSDKGYTINPPYRRMFFRTKPNEGTELAELYAEANGIDLDVADRIIRDFVEELESTLHAKKAIVFPGLGRLRATKENNIFFVADEDLDIYPAGFGLEPVSLKTHQETPEEVAAAVVGLKSIMEQQEEPNVMAAESEKTGGEPEVIMETEVLPEPEAIPETEVLPLEEETEPVEIAYERLGVPGAETAEAETTVPEITVPETAEAETTVPEEPVAIKKKNNVRRILLTTFGIIIAAALLLIVLLAVLGRTNPEFIDKLLYSQEELRILNHTL